MPKRKDQSADSDDEDGGIINIDFDFFAPTAIDYHATKNLLNQLFQTDAALLGVEALTELLIGQTEIGTTVKTDGQESDPYAFVTVVDLDEQKEHPSVAALRTYLSSKCAQLVPVLSPTSTPVPAQHTGWLFSERLINMPVQVVPPMYRMLAEELPQGTFDKLVIVSRTFAPTREMEDEWAAEARASGKRMREADELRQQEKGRRTMPFHFEDDIISQYATVSVDYGFTRPRETERTNESLGVETGGRIMVLQTSKLPALIEHMAREFPPPAA